MTKTRMPISIRFALRSPKKGQAYSSPHPLEVWITINRKRVHYGAVWPLKTGQKMQVNPQEWQVDQQRSTRRDDVVNSQLVKLKSHIITVFDEQHAITKANPDFPPTAESVYYELTQGKRPIWNPVVGWQIKAASKSNTTYFMTGESSLLTVYKARVAMLESRYGPSPTRTQRIEIGRWKRGEYLLERWQSENGLSVPACNRITLGWLKDYHAWLQTQKSDKQANPISAAMASRYIGKIGKVLEYMVQSELIERNNVKKQTWPRYNDKEIHFLEPEHVQRLFTLRWKRTKGIALWWFLLMCCTGLDYDDAVAYARHRSSLERIGKSGRNLVGKRLKSPHEPFDVPLLDEVEWLFSHYPKGPKDISGAVVNRYTDQMEEVLGIHWRITKKTARKTFACLMLINGYYIGEVSRMLGHKRVSTTESHYAKVLGTAVDRGRLRVGHNSLLNNILDRQN